jgi:hypothetical protein
MTAAAAALLMGLLVHAASGLLSGYAEGLQNTERHAIAARDRARATALNRLWHGVVLVARVGLAPTALFLIAQAAGVTGGPAVALAVAATLAWHLAHQLGHNGQQGKAYDYLGSMAQTDRLLGRFPRAVVFAAFAVATAAACALTFFLW